MFAIALLHDLRSSETESGPERMLRSLPLGTRWLYLRRTTIRGLALWLCVGVPFVVVAITQNVPVGQILAVLALAAVQLLSWVVLCLLISRRAWNSGVNAAALASCWVGLALVE